MPSDTSRDRLDQVVARAQRDRGARLEAYREKALKMYPWICGRCCREFNRENLRELTVHHRDHDHDNNPSDGSNWELLCMYCHDNEHSRLVDAHSAAGGAVEKQSSVSTYQPFANLAAILKNRK